MLAVDVIKSLYRNLSLRVCAAGSAALVLSSSPAHGDEVAGAGKEAAAAVSEGVIKAKTKFMDAVNGNREAQIELFTEYVGPILIAAVVICVGYVIATTVGRWVGTFVSKQVDTTLGRFAGKVVKTAIVLFTLMGVLSYFGFDITSFAAIIAALGFAVGMALSGTIGNFAAGIMLLLFRPFKVGDYVVMAGTEGTVEEIDLFTTQLNTLDNRRLIIPNGEVFGATIENVTHNQYRRVDVNVGCDYGACLDATRATLETAIANVPNAVAKPAPEAYLVELGDSSVNWQVRVWCKPSDYWGVRQDLTAATKKALDAASISIPFPQLDIHLNGAAGEVADALSTTRSTDSSLQKPRRRDAPVLAANVSTSSPAASLER